MAKLYVALAAALFLSGCVQCGADAGNGYQAGTCTAHTTFFAARAQAAHRSAFTKS